MTGKWSATLCHPKMHPNTKFGIPTSKNIGDMHGHEAGRTDGRTDGRCDYYMPPKVPLGALKNSGITELRVSSDRLEEPGIKLGTSGYNMSGLSTTLRQLLYALKFHAQVGRA